jgi:hypothetical protein
VEDHRKVLLILPGFPNMLTLARRLSFFPSGSCVTSGMAVCVLVLFLGVRSLANCAAILIKQHGKLASRYKEPTNGELRGASYHDEPRGAMYL